MTAREIPIVIQVGKAAGKTILIKSIDSSTTVIVGNLNLIHKNGRATQKANIDSIAMKSMNLIASM